MARMGCALLILVAVIVGYDQYRITQLQNEVRAISGKVHAGGPGKGEEGGGTDLVSALASAERHVMNAKELLKRRRPPRRRPNWTRCSRT